MTKTEEHWAGESWPRPTRTETTTITTTTTEIVTITLLKTALPRRKVTIFLSMRVTRVTGEREGEFEFL